MRLIKQQVGGYTRFTVQAGALTDSVMEASRWIGKHRAGTATCRQNLANVLRSMRERLRHRLLAGDENV